MRDLVPIKVKILLNKDGSAKYPMFNRLRCVADSGMDWSHYVDRLGTGWHYDCCGHMEEEDGSPVGQQWGMLLIPKEFADQAVSMFPDTVAKMSELQSEEFYNQHVARDAPEEFYDAAALEAIRLKQNMGRPLGDIERAAMDPDTNIPGIRRNRKKTFAGLRQECGVRIVQ